MKLSLLALLLLASAILAFPSPPKCFFQGERESGIYKTCFYSCPGGPAAITIRFGKLCPYSIEAPD
jgi:hypothetical protein